MHRSRILEKIGASHGVGIAVYAVQHRLLPA